MPTWWPFKRSRAAAPVVADVAPPGKSGQPAAPALPKGFPDWAALVGASTAWSSRRPGRRGRVLIATNIGGHGPATVLESTLAAALALRDAARVLSRTVAGPCPPILVAINTRPRRPGRREDHAVLEPTSAAQSGKPLDRAGAAG